MKTISKSLFYFVCLFLLAACQSKESKVVEATAVEVNKQCPTQIDIVTTLEKVVFESPKTLQYHYTLNLNELNTNIDELKESINQNITYNILNDKDLDDLKKVGTTFKYIYKDKEGKDLFDLTFSPDLYTSKEFGHVESMTPDKVFEMLQKSADLQNQQLPQAINKVINMYEVKAILPRTIEYVYRYTPERADLDTAYLASKQMKDELVYGLSKDNGDKMFKDNDVTFRFTYCDKDGIVLRTIDVTPEEYKQN